MRKVTIMIANQLLLLPRLMCSELPNHVSANQRTESDIDAVVTVDSICSHC